MGDRCDDRWFTNYTCTTFSKADALHFQAKGWNFVRLGVVWAGGQPTPEPQLDPEFERRLGNFLDLCHEHGIHVLLDVHEDSVGTATCGEGVPPWLSELRSDTGPGWKSFDATSGHPERDILGARRDAT